MGRCIPFSEIDRYLATLADPACLVDTSFLISVSDDDHHFFEDSQFVLEKVTEYEVPVFASVTARSEFIDFHRRVILTETLMDMIAPSSPWKITEAVRKTLKAQRGWIDNLPEDQDPYLPDSRIKLCKQAFLPRTHSGKIGWTEMCGEFLSGRL